MGECNWPDIFCDRTIVIGWEELVMNVILESARKLGKEECQVPGNSGYCILAGMLGKKLKERRSRIQWNKIRNYWNLKEAVNFEYCGRMPTV